MSGLLQHVAGEAGMNEDYQVELIGGWLLDRFSVIYRTADIIVTSITWFTLAFSPHLLKRQLCTAQCWKGRS